ncbi:MAG: hypothetical protein JXR41_13005 [Bacteroidales bacterium]|nr:hypothetical protein [Bacteroidales bacterium]
MTIKLKTMKKILVFITGGFITASLSFSQSEFSEGFVITSDRDTLHGWIDNRGDISNALKCFFRPDDSENIIEYGPTEIFSYRFLNGKYFIAKDISINNVQERRFLEFLLHGIIDLYCLRDINEIRYYVQKPGENMVELRQSEQEFVIDDTRYTKTDKEYIRSLRYLFRDAPALHQKIDNVYLNRKSLINITEDYHNHVCKDYDCIVYEKKLPRFKMNVGITGGFNKVMIIDREFFYTHLDWGDGYTYYCYFDPSIHAIAGLFINVPFLYSNDRFSFRYEAMLNENKFSSYSIHLRTGDQVDFSIDYMTLYNNFFVQYDIYKWNVVRPVIMLGGIISPNFNLKFEGDEDYNPFFNGTSYGISGGLGLKLLIKKKECFFINLLFAKNFGLLKNLNTNEISLRIGIPIFTLQ